jgi:Lrp/AsnC family transcriptional regulator of ectoine degradation
MKLDEIDIKLLVALQRNGRITNLHLAEEIGLSPSPCWERWRRLERAGVIRGYHADLALDRIVKTSVVFVEITLRAHEAHDFMRFEQAIEAVPEVVECHATGGGFDYLLKVVTTDIEHYQRLIENLLAADVGIHRYFTYIVTKPIKVFSGYPIKRLLSASESNADLRRRSRTDKT